MLAGLGALSACAFLSCGRVGGNPGADASPQAGADEQRSQTFFCFDTACSVGGLLSQELLDALVARCLAFDDTLSRTKPTSDIGRINAADGAPVFVEPETAELVAAALRYAQESDGLFDPTIGAVTELWDFHQQVVPSEEAVARALTHVGWRGAHVDEEACTITLDDPNARLDLGGIAKGYVTDVLVAMMAEEGVPSAYVNLGGNVAVLGPKADGTPWGIGVRDPFDETGEASIARVRATSGSVVTSGLYERSFEQGGRRWWHILDPRTGWPVETNIVSASIFAERSLDGDGLTKPLFMLDEAEALAFCEERGLDALLVRQDGTCLRTQGSAFELL